MIKNRTLLFLLLSVCMSMVTAKAFAHDIEVKNADGVPIYYNFVNNKTELQVTYRGKDHGKHRDRYTGHVNIPASVTYKGKSYSVTSIGEAAFWSCEGLTSVTIPNSVTSIGVAAFAYCRVKSITIPNSVTSIGDNAFNDCRYLTSINIPNNLTSIKGRTFRECRSLTSITIPNSVTSIEKYAFSGCKALYFVHIPNSAASIGEDAFDSSTNVVRGEVKAGIPILAQTIQKEVKQPQPVDTPKSQPIETPKQQTVVTPKQQTVATPKPQMTDVDSNIPMAGFQDRNTFAVVIGNEKYDNEAPVPFAENDARVFKEYLQKTLGVPEKQIRFIPNATLNNLRIAIRWLKQAMEVCGGTGKAIFYYAGHGIPDEADKTAYLLPTDGIGGDAETAYSLQKLYAELSKMTAQRTVVFLDACFSGAKREGDMMASARGVAIKVKASEPQGNMVVFTAAQGDETAYPYNSQQHGMFTYFLLKKMQDTKGDVFLGELGDYLTQEVKRESFVENNKMQTPSVNASSALANSWRSIKLR